MKQSGETPTENIGNSVAAPHPPSDATELADMQKSRGRQMAEDHRYGFVILRNAGAFIFRKRVGRYFCAEDFIRGAKYQGGTFLAPRELYEYYSNTEPNCPVQSEEDGEYEIIICTELKMRLET